MSINAFSYSHSSIGSSIGNLATTNFIGEWTKAGQTGAVCVHTILLPNSKLFCTERPHMPPYPPNPYTKAEIATEIDLKATVNADGTWSSKYTVMPIDSNTFCGGHSQRADGSIGIFGGDLTDWFQMDGTIKQKDGHKGRRTYIPCANGDTACVTGQWTADTDMTSDRWYPTVATLYDGTQIIVGGTAGNIDLNAPKGNNPTYEYYPSKEGAWPKTLDILNWCNPFCLYPSVFQLPSGRVFMTVSNKTIYIDPATETVTPGPDLISSDHMPWIYPFTPTFTMLPLTRKNKYRAVIQACGGSVASVAMTEKYASKECWQVAPDEPNPVWTRVTDLPNQRVMPDSVIIPDGKVIYLNGASNGVAGGVAGEALYTSGPVYKTDMFDPETKQFTTLAESTIQKLYHSEATLVQSGHIITTGSEMMNYFDYHAEDKSGPKPNCFPIVKIACTDPYNYQMERFTPPYIQLGEKNGGRPVIVNAPTKITYNTEMKITVKGKASQIRRVNFIRYSTVTHSTNTDQRLVELAILAKEGSVVTVRSPWNPAMAPPGNWMLWALDQDLVPSESATVLLQKAGNETYNFSLTDPNPEPKDFGDSALSSFAIGTTVLASILAFLL